MSVRIRGNRRRRKGCLGLLLGAMILPLVMGASGCDGNRSKTPPRPDLVVVKRDPGQSMKRCWELRIARGGDTRQVDVICVSQSEWSHYKKGDKYP